jgi:hypothetical protein
MKRCTSLWNVLFGTCGLFLGGELARARGAAQPIQIHVQPGVICEVDTALTDADPVVQGKFRKTYRLELSKDKTYHIGLHALFPRYFTPYLILLDAKAKILAEDNSDGKPSATLDFTPKETADYVLVVTTFPQGQTGEFRLRVGEDGARVQPIALRLQNNKAQVIGQLTPGEEQRLGKRCRAFSCDFEKGKTYQVRLESEDFDGYLYLLSPNGQVLAEDDDGAGEPNALLLWTAAETGTYRVLVTSYKPGVTGAFRLSITAVAPDVVLPVRLKNHVVRITGQLTSTAPVFDGKPSRAYSIKFEAGKTYQIDLVSTEFDAFLYLLGEGGKELSRDDDSGGRRNARIVYQVKVSGMYRIEACSLRADGAGKYTFLIKESIPALDLARALALPLQNGQARTTDRLAFSDPRLSDPLMQGKPCKAYAVQLSQGNKYRIELISDDFDAYLILLGPDSRILARDDDSGGDLNARLDYQVSSSGTYYILALCFDGTGMGNFTLTVTETGGKQ